MYKFLSSLKFTVILLISLVLILFWGILMSNSDSVYTELKQMNEFIIRDWFFYKSSNHTLLLIWFLILCVVAVLFGLNLILCTWDNLLKKFVKAKNFRSFSLFTLHFIFIMILLIHALSLLIGYKFSNIKLTEGEVFEFKDNFYLKVEKINFIDDKEIFTKEKKSRLHRTKDNFHYKENYTSVLLINSNDTIIKGDAFIFKPLFKKGIQLTLEKFSYDEKNDVLYANLAITKNPLTYCFFYFLWIRYNIIIFLSNNNSLIFQLASS